MNDTNKQKISSVQKIGDLFSNPAVTALVAFIIVMTLGVIFNSDGTFFKFGTHRDTLRQASVYGILATGMTIVIISGGIDLSVGSILALASVTFSIFTIHLQWPFPYALIAVLLIGATAGFISGGLIAYLKLQPFIATLAMMVFVRGVARLITGGRKISAYLADADGNMITLPMPRIFSVLDKRVLGGNINVVTIIFIVVFIISFILLSKHKWGREIYSIGGNEESARLSGVPVRLSKMKAYIYMGSLCGLAGMLQAAQETQGDPGVGTGYELTAIAMTVIGGTSLAGGKGSMVLTLVGILVIGYVEKILSINAVPEAGRLMITGIIIVLAVLAQSARK